MRSDFPPLRDILEVIHLKIRIGIAEEDKIIVVSGSDQVGTTDSDTVGPRPDLFPPVDQEGHRLEESIGNLIVDVKLMNDRFNRFR
jgi:hypothetical protein